MKLALICPSNILYMPYVENYTKVLKDNNIDYDIINWDRLNIEKESEFTYKDIKVGHQRGFLDYYKYSRFVTKKLNNNNYDKIIVFGIQLLFFLRYSLIKNYCNKFIIDIRDYNIVLKYFNIDKIIKYSNFVVLSSEGYKTWLPSSNKYVINHNTNLDNINELEPLKKLSTEGDRISIGFIGGIRDYNINIDFIDSLKNNNFINLFFNGEGDINSDISKYLQEDILRMKRKSYTIKIT